VLSRLELVEAYEEAWRKFSWSEHLTLRSPLPLWRGPRVAHLRGRWRSFSLSGSFRQPSVGFQIAIGGSTSTLSCWTLSLMRRKTCWPWRQCTTSRRWYSPFISHAHILTGLPCSVLVRTLPTGRVLRLEASQYPSTGNRKHEICSDVLDMITWRGDKLDDRLLVWNWKTSILLVNMV